jgi:biotin operon repressor
MNGRRWTKNEVWELLDLAQEVSQEQAAQQLGRTIYAVQQKMKSLGEQWRSRSISVEALAQQLGCSPTTVREAAKALDMPTTGEDCGRRYLLNELDAERLQKHLLRKLIRHQQQREAGRVRGKGADHG